MFYAVIVPACRLPVLRDSRLTELGVDRRETEGASRGRVSVPCTPGVALLCFTDETGPSPCPDAQCPAMAGGTSSPTPLLHYLLGYKMNEINWWIFKSHNLCEPNFSDSESFVLWTRRCSPFLSQVCLFVIFVTKEQALLKDTEKSWH